MPEFEPRERPPLVLPPVKPLPEEKERLPFLPRVFVREFRLTGNTVFSDEDLKEITAPFENRELTNEELQELRQRLTLHYVNGGYINSGAVLPDQKIVDGVVEIQIIEGRLVRIDVEGNKNFRADYFMDRLALGAGPPLNVKSLEERLQILLQSPLIDGIDAQLGPGDRPGEAILKTRVAEALPYELALGLDNKLPPSLGEVRFLMQGAYRNFAGRGDVLAGEIGFAEGLDEFDIHYALPITPRDTTLSVRAERTTSDVVEAPFDVLDIESEAETLGVALTYPVFKTANKQFTLGFGVERRSSDTSLLGRPFSFSPGVQEGESDVSVIRLSQDWLSRTRDQVIAARSTFSIGIEAFGSTINDDDPDSEFLAWLGQFQWARRLNDAGQQINFRADLQLSDEPLLPLEKFTVGGIDSVRGYRQNQLVRDQGYAVSLEWRTPIARNATGGSAVQLLLFADAGSSENKKGPNLDPTRIQSYGVGFFFDPHPKVHAELYLAKALEDIDTASHSIQDDGIHFRLVGRIF